MIRNSNKKKKFLAISMAMISLLSASSDVFAMGASGNASGNADKKEKESLADMDKKEKREILLQLGFIDDTINALTQEEIDEYCEKYIEGLSISVETETTLVNQEKNLLEDFSASEEDYLSSVDYSLDEEEIESQIECAKSDYVEKKEMYEDFTSLDNEKLAEKYCLDEISVKKIRSVVKSVKKDAKKKKGKGENVRGCSSSSMTSVSLVIARDYTFDPSRTG